MDTSATATVVEEKRASNPADFVGVCPRTAPVRLFDVTAITAAALPGGRLVYNPRVGAFAGNPGPLNDPTALIYVNSSDLDAAGLLRPGVPVEPLVLRAVAGDCIRLTLRNRLPAVVPDRDGFSGLPPIVMKFNANQIRPSEHVGMQPQMLTYDVSRDDGMNVGLNNGDGTVRPGDSITYRWYAGDLAREPGTDRLIATPVEFGVSNLLPADTIEQGRQGARSGSCDRAPGCDLDDRRHDTDGRDGDVAERHLPRVRGGQPGLHPISATGTAIPSAR